MYRPTTARRRPAARRGAILVVVLALLTIFAVVGIAFVFYSDGEMVAARYAKEGENRNGQMTPTPPAFDDDAELALSSVIFGASPTDVTAQVTNSLRGHDLLSGMYGTHGWRQDSPTGKQLNPPYSGAGIMHEDLTKTTNNALGAVSDRARVVNNTAMNVGGAYYVVDPEISDGPREVAKTQPSDPTNNATMTGKKYVPKNAPYTYPDLNNLYLASVSPATGDVMVPSYFRPWAFNDRPATLNGKTTPTPAPLGGRLAPWNPSDPVLVANTDWVTAEGRAKILRPRPIDQLTPAELTAAWGKGYAPTVADYQAPGFNAVALYNKIDEKIRDGSIIGYPRPNADNSTTGDVFSSIGNVGVQKNDSILIDFGATAFEWPRGSGKLVKPLAAVLVTDTDGFLNVNAHGNVRDAGNHASYHGFGPWEINLESATANKGEASTIVSARYGKWGSPGARNANKTIATEAAFDRSARRLGQYGQVNWDSTGSLAMGVSKAVLVPSFGAGANPFAVSPNYAAGFFDDNTDIKKAQNHPSLYNPADWAPFPEGQPLNPLPNGGTTTMPYGYTYSHAETRRLRQRYAGELDLYQQMSFNKLAGAPSGTLIGSFPAGATYRQDPAHPRRMLFTSLSAGLDLPGTMPQGQTSGTEFVFKTPGAYPPATLPAPAHASNSGLLSSQSWAYGGLGGVNLNRPLADYRDKTNAPLSSTNITAASANKAWADRQNLARDIFVRLVFGVGASGVSIDTDPTSKDYGKVTLPTETSTTDSYNGLRYLAQIAANVVDYIDGDDISTVFVWNPATSGTDSTNNVLGYATDANVASIAAASMTDPTKFGERVVFGVEVPRLVINEVYSEIVDDPNGPKGKGKGKGQGKGSDDDGVARFWVELMNPTSPAIPTGAPDGVLGTGKVVIKDFAAPGVVPYKLTIARGKKKGKTLADDVRYNPANVAGSIPAGDEDIDYAFKDATDGTGMTPKNAEVEPNNGLYDPAGSAAQGVVVVGSEVKSAPTATEFDPKNIKPMPPAWSNGMIVAPGLQYVVPNSDMNNLDLKQPANEYRRHVVLLRRLANPYLPENTATNPYITVDSMDWVPANNAAFSGNGNGAGMGGVPITDRVALGRVQPYAAHAYPDDITAAALPTYSFPASMSLYQAPTTAAMTEPKHTLGRHNGTSATAPAATTYTPAAGGTTPAKLTDTVMAPYDWLVHLDRSVVSPMELLTLQAGKPHEVTYYFLQPPAATNENVRKQVGLAPWFGVAPDPAAAKQIAGHPYTLDGRSAVDMGGRSNNGLYRGLEYLRVKPWTYGVPAGGRVHGKLNVNTTQDIRIWNALSDPQEPRKVQEFTQADSDKLWTSLFTSPTTGGTPGSGVRTYTSQQLTDAINQKWTVPAPGETVDDADPYIDPEAKNYLARLAQLDRPFKPFGSADALRPPPSGTWTPAMIAPGGAGLQDTIFRADPTVTPVTGQPRLYGSTAHPYMDAELTRKIANNTTTVSNVFTVHLTIVYHQVRAGSAETVTVATDNTGKTQNVTRSYLGAEAFREVPGDMRQQYMAVVDRSSAVVKPDTNYTSQTMQNVPYYVALDANANKGDTDFTITNGTANGTNSVLVYADGNLMEIRPGDSIIVGSGVEAEIVTVSSIPSAGTLRLGTGFVRPHPAGTVVTNAAFGRPTQPGSNFNPIKAPDTFRRNYPLLIPTATRVR
ncbi:MAG: hypothetical protein U0804_16250 [Gemmataceae bacterium]